MATAAMTPSNTQQQAQPPTIAVQRSSLDGLSSARTSNDAQWGAHFWVTLSDPQVCFYSFIFYSLSPADQSQPVDWCPVLRVPKYG